MKKIIFLSILAGYLIPGTLSAQIRDCRIYYTYDNAGNRIKRSQGCFDPDRPDEPNKPQFPLNPFIYPNPTTGPVTVGWNELAESARIAIVDMGGVLKAEREETMCYEIEHDISAYVPGAYIVILSVLRSSGENEQHEFKIVKEE